MGGPLVPPPGDHQVLEQQCPELLTYEGCTHLSEGVIYLAARPVERIAVLEHERGHLYDWRFLDDNERVAFRRLVKAPARWPWWNRSHDPQADVVAEWFADAYATCSIGRLEGWPGFWMNPNVGRGRQVCRFISLAWS